MPERRAPRRESMPHSALATRDREPVTLIHLSAEYYPFARAGGLAEAVANQAEFQSRNGRRTMAILPLYRSARKLAGELVPVGEPFEVRLGQRVETVRLMKQKVGSSGVGLHFIEHDGFFDRPRLYGTEHGDYPDNHIRFATFALASVMALPQLVSGPKIVHAHDWHAALALTYLRTRFAGTPGYERIGTVLSVHNAGYQGHYPPDLMPALGLPWELFNHRQLEWYGQLNLLKGGLVFADRVVTVSPNHAKELRTPEGGFGLQEVFSWLGNRFTGILNGIDTAEWDPAADEGIASRYSAGDLAGKVACKTAVQRRFRLAVDPRRPVIGMAARLVTQKGLDLVIGDLGLFSLPAQFIFIGQGEARFERALAAIAAQRPDRIAVDTKFTAALEHHVMAGADFLLMPCQYEPCGLSQMKAQRYGVAPIVRRVGGLADTVDDGVTGFVFEPYASESLIGATIRGLDIYWNPPEWDRMRQAAMTRDFSWDRSARSYLEVYREVVAERCETSVAGGG